MPDGVTLPADRYYPCEDGEHPTILVRTPYGRRALRCGWAFAERGFQVVIQSVRGSDDAGGEFVPFVNERSDGIATIGWLKRQPWFNGKLGMFGASYLGYTQWAIADCPEISAMSVQMGASSFEDSIYPGGAFALDDALVWAAGQEAGTRFLGTLRQLTVPRRVRKNLGQLPVGSIVPRATGRDVGWLGHWLDHDESYWERSDQTARASGTKAAVHLTTGWWDFCLPQLLRDYELLRRAGAQPYLTIGPWGHRDVEMVHASMAETIDWFADHLGGRPWTGRSAPVRVHTGGAEAGWREFLDWPPPGYWTQEWFLAADGQLAPASPADRLSDSYVYDPNDPTPRVGGPLLHPDGPAVVDTGGYEERDDVLVYTSAPLPSTTEIGGPVRASVYLRSSQERTDLVVRLCDVDETGVSRNVCDGVRRCEPGTFPRDADGVSRAEVELNPASHRFAAGHRLRVHVASGAHPRFARNLGTDEPLASGTRAIPAKQEVFHGADRPSALTFMVAPL
jgi:uncharacterized protein